MHFTFSESYQQFNIRTGLDIGVWRMLSKTRHSEMEFEPLLERVDYNGDNILVRPRRMLQAKLGPSFRQEGRQ